MNQPPTSSLVSTLFFNKNKPQHQSVKQAHNPLIPSKRSGPPTKVSVIPSKKTQAESIERSKGPNGSQPKIEDTSSQRSLPSENVNTNNKVYSELIEAATEKMKLLEREIATFQKENEKLRLMKENVQKEFEQQMSEFEAHKSSSLASLDEEWKKLQKEKKGFNERTKGSYIERKNGKSEAEQLKQQLESQKADFVKERQKYNTEIDRMKARIDTLTKQNGELEEQVKVLEKKSLQEYWGDNKQSLNKPNSNKDKLRESDRSRNKIESRPKETQSYKGDTRTIKHETHVKEEEQEYYSDDQIIEEDFDDQNFDYPDEEQYYTEDHYQTQPTPSVSRSPLKSPTKAFDTSLLNSSLQQLPAPATVRNTTFNNNGSVIVHYKNGTKKMTDPDGRITVYFLNGDYKEVKTYPDGSMVYTYKAADPITQVCTLSDGTQVLFFTDGTSEHHYTDGVIEYVNGDMVTCVHPDGTEEVYSNKES